MKATILLTNEHEKVRSLFAKYKNTATRNQYGKQGLFDKIRRQILVHSQMAADVFYMALASTPSAIAGQLASTAEEEHRSIQELLDSMNTQDKDFDTKMEQLMEAVNRHIEMEEEQLFDEARKVLPEYRLEELGLEMENWRRIWGPLAA